MTVGERAVRGFYRHSEMVKAGNRWVSYTPHGGSDVDDLMIGLYYPSGGSKFEFKIMQHQFDRSSDRGIQVCVFDDAFVAFSRFRAFFKWLEEKAPSELDIVQEWLLKHGFRNMGAEKK